LKADLIEKGLRREEHHLRYTLIAFESRPDREGIKTVPGSISPAKRAGLKADLIEKGLRLKCADRLAQGVRV